MKILFFDIEVTAQKKIAKLGAIDQQGNMVYNGNNVEDFFNCTKNYDVLAGHNILHHDLEYLSTTSISTSFLEKPIIDTLRLSSLIFIRKPYHKLIKDYKTEPENLEVEDERDNFFMRHQPGGEDDDELENDPVRDSLLSLNVFNNCVEEFQNISPNIQQILYGLLGKTRQFGTFFSYLQEQNLFTSEGINLSDRIERALSSIIKPDFFDKELPNIIEHNPVEFAYIFRLVEQNLNRDLSINPDCSILPRWITYSLPDIDKVFSIIYKFKNYDLKQELKGRGLQNFRVYDNEHGPKISQEEIVEEGFNGGDFIAVLATGGGKSLCFQLPALARADASGFLTIVISPLQSLMEDQVSNLKAKYHKMNVGALHSGMDPLTRKEVRDRVSEGGIDLLYLSPEMLRTKGTQDLLSKRHIDRLVIDEAHCFSKWGHDFRIDYMFIADFIKELGKVNPSVKDISISCFTATAKQEVIKEIKDYFKNNFDKDLREFKSTAKRPNLNYEAYDVKQNALGKSVDDAKFEKLIDLLEKEVGTQPCIIFTRYTGQSRKIGARNLTKDIENRLIEDGYGEIKVAYFHGQLSGEEKSEMMYKFMNGEVNVIVATNAFGMGVDKTDVRFVIHYNMPASLENYLQEAGRAGRDQQNSRCIILYSSDDLDENLQLNNLSRLKKEELQKLLKYIKKEFQKSGHDTIVKSIRNLIQSSGWIGGDFNDEYTNNKTTWDIKLKTALSFLEKPFPNENEPWFISRGLNRTRRIATSARGRAYSLYEVYDIIDKLGVLTEKERAITKSIYHEIKNSKLLSIEDLPGKVAWRLHAFVGKDSENKEILYKGVEELVDILRDENILELEDEILLNLNANKNCDSLGYLKRTKSFIKAFFDIICEQNGDFIDEGSEILRNKSQLNALISKRVGEETRDMVQEFSEFLEYKHKIAINGDHLVFRCPLSTIKEEIYHWIDAGEVMLNMLLDENTTVGQRDKFNIPVTVRLKDLASSLGKKINEKISITQMEEIVKFLTYFSVVNVDSGLFLYHTKFTIKKGNHLKEISETGKERYTTLGEKHYKALSDFYTNKTQQAHIMDRFVQYVIKGVPIDRFVDDYFNLDYEFEFLPKYFTKEEIIEISRSTSKAKHNEIWDVSDEQKKILESNKNLLVVAGPGSGKTRSLVHKVATLVLEEGISKDEFLLLTFMRSAKFELKNRIIKLVGPQGYGLEIHTFHGFAYSLLGKDPLKEDYNESEDNQDQIIKDAIKFLNEHEDIQLPYRVIMLDEFQDIGKTYFDFVEAISNRSAVDDNKAKINIIATGDDDQSIMDFKGGDIKYIQNFQEQNNAESVILTRNYRSTQDLVDYTTNFAETIRKRLKTGTKLVSGRQNNLTDWVETHIEAWNCSGNYLFGVKDALEVIESFDGKGTTAVICAENETVLQINHLLQKKGIKAQILLSGSGYKLRDSLEFRRFLEVCNDEDYKVTKDNIWEKYETVCNEFGENKNTDFLKKIVENIDATNNYINPKVVDDFMLEIKDEADLVDDHHRLFVSTFHKAKGREFDNVIICFDPNKNNGWNNDFSDEVERDKIKRLIYVGMTRAKNNLILMGNKESNKYFEFLYNSTENKKEKQYIEDEADEISVITSLKDVFLSYNDDKIIRDPRIGADIQWKENTLQDGSHVLDFYWEGNIIQKSSRDLVKSKLSKWYKKDYYIASTKVYQKLIHRTRDDDKEHMIFVFDLSLKKLPREYKDINEAKNKIEVLESQIQMLESKGINNTEDNEKYLQVIETRNAQIQVLQEKTYQLEIKLTEAQENIKNREQEIADNEQKIKELENDIQGIRKEKEIESEKVSNLEKDLIKAQSEGNKKIEEKLYKELEDAKNSLKETEGKLTVIEGEKTVLETKTYKLEEENNILKIENEELKKKVSSALVNVSNPKKSTYYVFKAGETENICNTLIKLMEQAKKSVILIEPYMDQATIDLLSHRRIGVKGIIKYDKKKTLYSVGIDGNPNKLSELLSHKGDQEDNPIRITATIGLHDRYLIIDDVVWSIGTSMNATLGDKPTTIQETNISKDEILNSLSS